MGLVRRDNVHYTYGDYLGWPEDVRYELIDGEAFFNVCRGTPRRDQSNWLH